MTCSRCGSDRAQQVGALQLCPACIAADRDIYYSIEHLRLLESDLEAARAQNAPIFERGIGHDRLSNPTKGRARLNAARSEIDSIVSSIELVRSVLIPQGAITPTLFETLDRKFHDAKHNEVVTSEGVQYRRRWINMGIDSSGRNIWRGEWDIVARPS